MTGGAVLYVTRMLASYRRPILERLNERLDGRLIVCSGQTPGTSSLNYLMATEAGTPYKRLHLKNYWLAGDRIHAQPFGEMFDRHPHPAVVLAEESPRSITLPSLLRAARKRGAGRVLWGHFSSLNRPFDPHRNVADRLRLMMARRVEACACYTPGVADMLRPYIDDERLFVARNTIDLDPMFADYERLSKEGKEAVRRSLGVPTDASTMVFLGRLIPEKGTSELMEAFARLAKEGPAALLVIGDGPERVALEDFASRHRHVHILGPLSDAAAAPYLFAGDVMVMPGYLGLVINHAFAFGLPIVSFRDPAGINAHSPEVEYVESGKNGLFAEGQSVDDLVAALRTVLGDLPAYSENALDYARQHLTVDRMVDGLEGAVRFAENRS